jgi:hypothetical protein
MHNPITYDSGTTKQQESAVNSRMQGGEDEYHCADIKPNSGVKEG